MTKVAQTQDELEQQLDDQLDLLDNLAQIYDQGKTVAAKSMATTIRVLLHDSKKSASLLGQLGKKNTKFYDTAEVIFDPPGTMRAGTFSALLGIAFGESKDKGYVPHFDSMPARMVDFDEYWNEVIFIDQKKANFTRKDIVLFVANQDGGSHVDPGLDEKYAELSRKNSLGWKLGNDTAWEDLKGAELASIRQITHELLKTYMPGYEFDPPQNAGPIVGAGGFVMHFAKPGEELPRRKGPCPCGSGKKYKRCCGS